MNIPRIKIGDSFSLLSSFKKKNDDGSISDATLPDTITSRARVANSRTIVSDLTVERISATQYRLSADTTGWPAGEIVFDVFYQGLPGGINLHSDTVRILTEHPIT